MMSEFHDRQILGTHLRNRKKVRGAKEWRGRIFNTTEKRGRELERGRKN